MAHPFFDSGTYPWDRPDAQALHRALYRAVPQPAQITLLYRQAATNLPAIVETATADEIWKDVLEALAAAHGLKRLVELILGESALAAVHREAQAVLGAAGVGPIIALSSSGEASFAAAPDGARKPIGLSLPTESAQKLYGSLTRLREELTTQRDRSFVATHLYQRVDIVRPDAHVTKEETLTNVSGADQTDVVRIVVSDSPAPFEDLQVAATIEHPGHAPYDAAIDATASGDGRVFNVTIGFRGRVVPPGGVVTIRWKCVVPSSVRRPDEYWVFPFVFSEAAERVTLEAGFPQEPADVHLFLDDYDAQAEVHYLKPISLSEPRAGNAGGRKVVVYHVERYDDKEIYLFTWKLRADGVRSSGQPKPSPLSSNEPGAPAPEESPEPPPVVVPPKPDGADENGGVWDLLNPAVAVKAAIAAVPPVKYALGVLGIAAVAAIGTQYFATPGLALVSTAALLVMMVLLVVFAALVGNLRERSGGGGLVNAALVLAWAMMLVLVIVVSLLCLSVFFDYPKTYPELVAQFRPITYGSVTVTVATPDGKPVSGAHLIAHGNRYRRELSTDTQGTTTFSQVPSTDTVLTVVGEGPGHVAGRIVVDVTETSSVRLVLMPTATPVAPPPASAPADPAPKPPARGGPSAATRPRNLAAELPGTWEVLVTGAAPNVRVRRGTFQFAPQPDGEVLVTASFMVDNMQARLTGRATVVGSRVFVKYSVTTAEGGSWSGEATFQRPSANQLTGRIEAKNGDDVAIELRKIVR